MEANQLRTVVDDCMTKRLFSSAAFFSEKLLAASLNAPQDVYRLAKAFFEMEQYKRSQQVLLQMLAPPRLLSDHPDSLLLAAITCIKQQEWDECLELLQWPDDIHHLVANFPLAAQSGRMLSALCLQLGIVYDMTEQRKRAAYWLCQALLADVYCFDALDLLNNHHLLTRPQESELLQQMAFSLPEQAWLKDLYACRLEKYEVGSKASEDRASGCITRAESQKKAQEERVQRLEEQGLASHEDVALAKAEYHFAHWRMQQALDITFAALKKETVGTSSGRLVQLHVAALVELRQKNALFYLSHQLVERQPNSAVSWYSVGCYYLLLQKYDVARRYFSKAMALDRRLGVAWVAFGHCFAAQAEHDQAMAAYRAAGRLLTGSHLPMLFIAMEQNRVNHVAQASEYLAQSIAMVHDDPLAYNELAVLLYKSGEYGKSIELLQKAIEYCGGERSLTEPWEALLFNLAHAHRKLRNYDAAIGYYLQALDLSPHNGSIYSALGFCYHLQGDPGKAVECYHQALAHRASQDGITSDLLNTAVAEMAPALFASTVQSAEAAATAAVAFGSL